MKNILVVGGGISGLTTAYYLKRELPDINITIIEKESRVGGKLGSTNQEGYIVDWAANGFLSNEVTLELVRQLGLEDKLQEAAAIAKHRFIYRDGKLKKLPISPRAFLTTGLLEPSEKLRLIGELFCKVSRKEETVFEFIKRHFGKGFADAFADIFVIGIAAGDAKELSINALFPNLKQLEKEHGSLIKALIHKQRQAKKSGKPKSRLIGFQGGMQILIDALEKALEPHIRCNVAAYIITPTEKGYNVALSSGEVLDADTIVFATPAFSSAELLRPLLSGPLANFLAAIPYADMRVFGLGFKQNDVPIPLDGFGFLVPRNEGLRTLGVLYSSTIFPNQVPEGNVALRVLMGGTVDPTFSDLPDNEALKVVLDELQITMGIDAEPEAAFQIAWPRSIPQYQIRHRRKVDSLMKEVESKNIFLTGNAFYGIGVNDCVIDAKRVVATLKSKLLKRSLLTIPEVY